MGRTSRSACIACAPPPSPLAHLAAPASPPPRLTQAPRVVWSGLRPSRDDCGGGAGRAAGAASAAAPLQPSYAAHYAASHDVLVTPRHVVLVSACDGVRAIEVPFTRPRRQLPA